MTEIFNRKNPIITGKDHAKKPRKDDNQQQIYLISLCIKIDKRRKRNKDLMLK